MNEQDFNEEDINKEIKLIEDMLKLSMRDLFPNQIERVLAMIWFNRMQDYVVRTMNIGLHIKKYAEILRLLANILEMSDEAFNRLVKKAEND